MASCPTTPILFKNPWLKFTHECACEASPAFFKRKNGGRAGVHCSATADGEVVGILGEGQRQDGYLARGFGWGVRRMVRVEDEMRRVAEVQAEAFHEPVALFNDFFFEFFKAEVLSALLYRVRSSPIDRYACLVAESLDGSDSLAAATEIVGVVDATVQREEDVLRHLQGAEEYLYVSGIAVLIKFRRRKVGTVLLEACDVLSRRWGYDYVALRAYEDDSAAQRLYSKAGYRVASRDPHWVTWIGKKRRVLMIKHFASASNSDFYPHC